VSGLVNVVKSILSDIISGPSLNKASEKVIFCSPTEAIVLTLTLYEPSVMLSTARLITRREVLVASV
jgi:hypothetical protein